MIGTGTMHRITRVKQHLRDVSRADVARAEVQHDAARLERERLERDRGHAQEAFESTRDSSPDALELMALVLVQSNQRLHAGKALEAERAAQLETERERRVEAERDLRGIELAGERERKRQDARTARAEDRLAELWAARRRR